jgi:hypothetical protein
MLIKGIKMKVSQKAKYIGYGVIGAIVAIPLAIKAVETIPLTFKEGDVISASVINTLLQRVNDVQKGFSSVDELNGTWSCTVYDTGAFGTDQCTADGAILRSKTGNLTFNSANKTWAWAGAGSLNDCGSGGSSSGNYDVKAGILITDIGVYDARKNGPNEFVWFITNSMPPSGFNRCIKTSTAPAPANDLTASVNGTSVVLSWTDGSTNETGFKVERKVSATAAWETITTTAANATSYTVSGLSAGTYWFRVIATNNNGDAMSSSEVQAVVR